MRIALMLPRDDQRPVLLERAGIDQLRRCSRAASGSRSCGGVATASGPVLVQRQRVPLDALAQVVADVVEVDRLRGGDGAACDLGLLDEDDREALAHDVARRHRDAADDAAAAAAMTCSIFIASTTATCWPCTHRVAVRDVDRDDGALDRRGHADRSIRARSSRAHRPRPAPAPLPPSPRLVGEQRQRVACSSTRRRRSRSARGDAAVRLARSAAAARPWRRASPSAHRASACARVPPAKSGCARIVAQERRCWWRRPRGGIRSRRASVARDGVGEIRRGRVGDHLREQRVERADGAVAGVAEAVGAHAGPARRLVDGERAAAGPHGAVGADRLHVDAGLDRVAARRAIAVAVEAQFCSVAPCARRICVCTRSTPVTASVTVCSTCSRAFASMKTNGCASSRPETSTRNSNVPRLL